MANKTGDDILCSIGHLCWTCKQELERSKKMLTESAEDVWNSGYLLWLLDFLWDFVKNKWENKKFI